MPGCRFRRLAAMGVRVVLAGTAHAWPDRPLKLVVPFPPTGTADVNGTPRITKMVKLVQSLSTPALTDALAQNLASGLAAALEQAVLIERKASGMTVEGVQSVARAPADGHTLLFAGSPTLTIYPLLFRQLALDPQRDLVPVAPLAELPIALVTDGDNPARSVRAVIERVRFVPGQVNFAGLGEGTTSHLAHNAFRALTGTQIVRVGYNGSTPALNAVATRNVEFGFVPLTAALPFIGGGKVRLIAVGSARRHPAVPDTPTLAESGVEGYAVSGWFGVFARAGTAPAIVSLLNYSIHRVTAEQSWQHMLVERGLFALRATPEEFRTRIAGDTSLAAHWLANAAARADAVRPGSR